MATGDPINWSDVAQHVQSASITTNSATWVGTESGALITVTAALVNGWNYRVTAWGSVLSSVASDISLMRIREDTASGTQDQAGDVFVQTTTGNGWPFCLYAEYTAAATGNKTWVLTGQRNTGTGNNGLVATANRPCYLTVDRLVS